MHEWKKLGATEMLSDSEVMSVLQELIIKRNVPNNKTSKRCVTSGNENKILAHTEKKEEEEEETFQILFLFPKSVNTKQNN